MNQEKGLRLQSQSLLLKKGLGLQFQANDRDGTETGQICNISFWPFFAITLVKKKANLLANIAAANISFFFHNFREKWPKRDVAICPGSLQSWSIEMTPSWLETAACNLERCIDSMWMLTTALIGSRLQGHECKRKTAEWSSEHASVLLTLSILTDTAHSLFLHIDNTGYEPSRGRAGETDGA